MKDLRCDVARRPTLGEDRCVIGCLDRKSEVCDLDFVVLSLVVDGLHENVVGLYIAMNDLLLLKEVKHKQDLLHDDSYLHLRKLLVVFQVLHKGALWLILKHQDYEVFVFVYAQDFEDAIALLKSPVRANLIEKCLNPIIDPRKFLFL